MMFRCQSLRAMVCVCVIGLLPVSLFAAAWNPAATSLETKPNLIFIMADDK